MIRKQNPKLVFSIFLVASVVFPALAVIRKNEEFLFFGGVLCSMFQIYNYAIFQDKNILRLYLLSDLLFCGFAFLAKGHAFSFYFPLPTLLLIWAMRAVYYHIRGRSAEDGLERNSISGKLYFFLSYLLPLGLWIALILLFLDKQLK